MFLLSVQTSKELEPQCDDQITLDCLSFHRHYFPPPSSWVAVCAAGGRGRGERASPAETGLFHWTMKPFCEPLSGHVHNAAVGVVGGTGRSLITTVPRLPRVRNFQIQTYMHCFIYQFSVPPSVVAKELQALDQKQINKQKIHVCMKGKFLCLSLLSFELCSFIHSASSYSESPVLVIGNRHGPSPHGGYRC